MKINDCERNNSDIDSFGYRTVVPLCTVIGSKMSYVTVTQLKLACNENSTMTGHAGGHHAM